MTHSRPLTPCRHPGCPALVTRGYCDKHQRSTGKALYDATRRKDDPRLAMSARVRSSGQWQCVRELHRALHPLCCDPFGQHPWPVPNEASHHIIPIHEAPQLAFDLANLAPLCTACHNRIERMERSGRDTRGLFVQAPCQPRVNGM
jgi:5-methylcytosine-specific restriction protein A